MSSHSSLGSSLLRLLGVQILSLSFSSLPVCSSLWLDCHIDAQSCLNLLLLFLERYQLLFLLRIAFLSRDPSNERDFSYKTKELLLISKFVSFSGLIGDLATRVLLLLSSSPPQWNISRAWQVWVAILLLLLLDWRHFFRNSSYGFTGFPFTATGCRLLLSISTGSPDLALQCQPDIACFRLAVKHQYVGLAGEPGQLLGCHPLGHSIVIGEVGVAGHTAPSDVVVVAAHH